MRAALFPPLKENKPKYLAIAESIREAVSTGKIKPGEKLPSSRELARLMSTTKLTILSALNELIAEGWITSEQRRAYRVAEKLPRDYYELLKLAPGGKTYVKPALPKLAKVPQLGPFSPPESVPFNFQSGIGDFREFPIEAFRMHVREVLKTKYAKTLLDYGAPAGFEPLRESIGLYLRRLRGITKRAIFMTNGSQEGIYLLARLLLKPGDAIAVEELCYPPARETFLTVGARLVGIPLASDGLDVDRFEKIAASSQVKMLYLTPLHQFPTTRTLSLPSRLRLYEIAAKNKILILEDDYDHEFHYRSQPLPPMASQDPEGLVLYVSTFSKILFPSARIGFLAVPEGLISPLTQYRRIISHQNDSILQAAFNAWIREGGMERHIRKMRRLYHERRDKMVECLRQITIPLEWRVPDGGMALWLNTFKDADKITQRAAKNGVFVVPESYYQITPKSPSTHLRLNFANLRPDEIVGGIDLLKQSL